MAQPFILNSKRRSWIDPAGFTSLCLGEGHDAADVSINDRPLRWLGSGAQFYASGKGETTEPYLEVVVAAAGIIFADGFESSDTSAW